MFLLTTDQQAEAARRARKEYRARLAGPAIDQQEAGRLTNLLADTERAIALWEAGIREPVPGTPDRPDLGVTVEAYQAMNEEAEARYHRQLTIATDKAEIANIDRQIGIALDRIADWRRHRAWLEQEIADLTSQEREPVHARS